MRQRLQFERRIAAAAMLASLCLGAGQAKAGHRVTGRRPGQIGRCDAGNFIDQGRNQHIAIAKADLEVVVHHGAHATLGDHQAFTRLEEDDDVDTDEAHAQDIGRLDADRDVLRHLEDLVWRAVRIAGF